MHSLTKKEKVGKIVTDKFVRDILYKNKNQKKGELYYGKLAELKL